MRTSVSIFISLIILAILGNCNNEPLELSTPQNITPRTNRVITKNSIMGKWKILSSSLQNKTEISSGNYFLVFSEVRTNSIYELILDKEVDVNACGGTYDILSENRISIGSAWCTKVCCDSKYAETLAQIINSEMSGFVTNYTIRNDSLILKSTATITLYRVK